MSGEGADRVGAWVLNNHRERSYQFSQNVWCELCVHPVPDHREVAVPWSFRCTHDGCDCMVEVTGP